MILPSEDLEKVFNANKGLIDKAYNVTKDKYGATHAGNALYHYFIDFDCSYITRDFDARANLKKFVNYGYQNLQILYEYAIASFILNGMKTDVSLEEINMYANDDEGKLNYDKEHITKIIALSIAAWGPYWADNLLACNKKVKFALVDSFISERYFGGRAMELDSCPRTKLVDLGRGKKMLSIRTLNNDIMNLINQDESESLFDVNGVDRDNSASYGSR